MEFLKLAEERFSCRKFKSTPVEKEKVDKIIKAGLVAPTAHNNQPCKIIVCNTKAGLEKFRRCTECHYNAPLGLVVIYDKNLSWKRAYDGADSGVVDASIITTHMMLEAQDLNIGTTWIMYYIPEAVREEFNLKENEESVALMVMGYPADDVKPSPSHLTNKDPKEIVFYK